MNQSKPMRMICRFCKTPLWLNADSQHAREAGSDPLRQMQRHLRDCPKSPVLTLGFNAAVLINALAFRPALPEDESRYKSNIMAILDWLIAGGIEDNSFPGTANAEPTAQEHPPEAT